MPCSLLCRLHTFTEHTTDLEDGGNRIHPPIKVHGITTQHKVMLILTAVRISLSDMCKDPVWTSHAT